ncbi:MAG: CoA transferase [Xanthomonadales bacterium]|nr:CoA transferase [Xanthomonadales bacterium]
MGPLQGFKIIEIAGIGPGQFAGMLLADMGASVLRIDRPVNREKIFAADARYNIMNRSRPLINVDLKTPQGVDTVLDLCRDADAIFEGFRPGVMERLGLGPEDCMARNRKLVYGRMTGWGQQGPLAKTIGHDANFIALSGVYGCIGEKGGDPVYPLNLVGDMGGGGAYLVIGMLAAILEAGRSGQGQVVDAAMVDGAASQMTSIWGLRAAGLWKDQRGSNVLDGGAPFYMAYRTSDNQYIAVAPIENRFYRNLLEVLNLDDIDPDHQHDRSQWDNVRRRLQAVFATRTRDEWTALLDGTETCCTAVLSMAEVDSHPHNAARETFVSIDGITQPAPAPRFSRTESAVSCAAGAAQADLHRVLKDWGASDTVLAKFIKGNQP